VTGRAAGPESTKPWTHSTSPRLHPEPQARHLVRERPQRRAELEAGEGGAEAVVRPAAEGDVAGAVAAGAERVRVGEPAGVGRLDPDEHHVARRDRRARDQVALTRPGVPGRHDPRAVREHCPQGCALCDAATFATKDEMMTFALDVVHGPGRAALRP